MPSFLGPVESTPFVGGAASGDIVKLSGMQHVRKTNLAASGAPTATDDSAAGYEVGSVWVDTVGQAAYVCLSATTSAAVWKDVSTICPPYAGAADLSFWRMATWGDSLTLGLTPLLETTITTAVIQNGGVGGETSAQIKTRMLADTASHSDTTIIWAGNNDLPTYTTVVSDVAAMVAALPAGARFLVLSCINGENPLLYSGTAGHTALMAVNASLAAAYPSNYFDVRAHLISLSTHAGQDLIDDGHDIVPASVRVDGIHLTTAAYQLVANQIAAFVSAHLTPTLDHPLSFVDLPDVFALPPRFGAIVSTKTKPIWLHYVPLITATAAGYNYGFGGAGNDTMTGTYNTCVGYLALAKNTSGGANAAIGDGALGENTQGNFNTAIGENACRANTTGSGNVGEGYWTLYANQTGNNNTAVGYQALNATTGSGSTAVGYHALVVNVSGAYNTAVGYEALAGSKSGGGNTAIGDSALKANVSGSNNTAVGASALTANTGTNNTAFGYYAMRAYTGNSNTAFGYYALYSVVSGGDNTAVGTSALEKATGAYNTGVGSYVLTANTSGTANVGLGMSALGANQTSSNSTAIGTNALGSATAGSNTGVGRNACYYVTSGVSNVAVGAYAGFGATATNAPVADDYGILIGYQANRSVVSATKLTNYVGIGYGTLIDKSNQVKVGNASIVETILYGSLGVGAPAFPTGGGVPVLALVDSVSSITGAPANVAGLQNKAGELYAWDASSNVTLISPHAKDGPPEMYTGTVNEAVAKSHNDYTGVIRWQNLDTGKIVYETAGQYNARRGLTDGDPEFRKTLGCEGWASDEREKKQRADELFAAYVSGVRRWSRLHPCTRGKKPTRPERYVARPYPF